MHLYLVKINGAVLHGEYYIVAEGFDAAASKALEMDTSTGGDSSVSSVTKLVPAGGDEAGFTMTDEASSSLGFYPA